MIPGEETTAHSSAFDRTRRIDELCERFESQWLAGATPHVEEYLTEVSPEHRPALQQELEWLRNELAARDRVHASPSKWPPIGGIVGEYELLAEIGQGGMGHVYKARHVQMGRIVALKRLSPALAWRDSARASRRFRREVRATARLRHPNVVTAFDAGEHHGVPYLVMEYIEGIDLGRLVKQRGPLPISEALALLLQVARGLDYAHREGIIHRDVKPSNLQLAAAGDVKLLDLGLARIDAAESHLPGTDDASVDLTASGTFLGSIDYMAPEQAVDTRRADVRSDIYSMGCTLHYLLTGRPVYAGATSFERLLAHREAPIPSLSAQRGDCPEALDTLFHRMLAKRPEDRLQTVAALADELEVCRQGLGPQHAHAADVRPGPPSAAVPVRTAPLVSAPPDDAVETIPSSIMRAARQARRQPALLATVALATFAGFALLTLRPRDPGKSGVLLMTDQHHINGARVEVDGARVTEMASVAGALPYAAFDVTSGEHTITISKPGYKPLDTSFQVAPGKRWEISIRLFPEDEPAVIIPGQTAAPSP